MPAIDDASLEERNDDRGLQSLDDEVGAGSRSAGRGLLELAMEVVTAERTCLWAERLHQSLQEFVYKTSAALGNKHRRS